MPRLSNNLDLGVSNGYAQVVYQGKDAVIDKRGNLYYSEDIIKGNKKASLNVKG